MARLLQISDGDMTVPPCTARLVLIRITGSPFLYEMSALLMRVDGSKWAVGAADGTVSVDDLSEEEVIALTPGELLPTAGRPMQVRSDWSDSWLDPLRAQARSLVEIYGGTAALGTEGGASWYWADTSHPSFGKPIDRALLGASGALVSGSSALLPEGGRMNFSERVAASDLDRWLQDKREGHGRDPRLLAAAPADTTSPSAAGPSLFRDVAATFEVGVVP